jgi:hypothetical protein
MAIILRKHQLTNVCTLFFIWVVTFHIRFWYEANESLLLQDVSEGKGVTGVVMKAYGGVEVYSS